MVGVVFGLWSMVGVPMSLIGYLIIALAKVIGLAVDLYTMIVIAAALISWVSPDPYNPLVRILSKLTRPVFSAVRRCLPGPLLRLRIDISPIIVLIALTFIDAIVRGALMDLGRSLIVH